MFRHYTVANKAIKNILSGNFSKESGESMNKKNFLSQNLNARNKSTSLNCMVTGWMKVMLILNSDGVRNAMNFKIKEQNTI